MNDDIRARFNIIGSIIGFTVDRVCQLSAVTSDLPNNKRPT